MQDLFGDAKTEDKPKKKKKKKDISPNKKDDKVKLEFPEPESFESAMAKLEGVLRTLESGQISLEKSLEVYREAKFLAGWCYKKLNSIEGELKKLGLDELGNLSIEDFPTLE